MFKLLHIIVVFYICADQIYGLICYICLPEIFTAEECKTVTNGFVDACYHQDVCKTFFFKKKNHQVGIHRSCADRLCSECKFPMFFLYHLVAELSVSTLPSTLSSHKNTIIY